MKVLVTGGAGFIGSHSVALLTDNSHEVVVLDNLSTGSRDNLRGLPHTFVEGDLRDEELLREVVQGVDAVLHLAARASVPASCADPVDFCDNNALGTVKVFQAARRAGVSRVVYASSSAVYGDEPNLPSSEDDPLVPASPYGADKRADELYGAVFHATLGLQTVGLRYFNVFGAKQDPNGPYAAVVPKFVSRALSGKPLLVFGDGEQGRDFVSVHDVARANLAALTHPDARGVYNVGTGDMVTVNKLAKQVLAVMNVHGEIRHEPPREGDVRYSCANVDRIADQIGWKAKMDFHAAMAETIAWYRDWYETR